MPRPFLAYLLTSFLFWLCISPARGQDAIWIPLITTTQPLEATLDSLREELSKVKTDTSRIKLMFLLGAFHAYQNLDSAQWYAQQALRLARKVNYTTGELHSNDLLSFTYSERDIPQSMQLALENMHLAQQLGNRLFLKWSYQRIGLLNLYLENYPQAITYFKRGHDLAFQDNDKSYASAASTELAGAYLSLQQPDSARYYLTLAAKEDSTSKQNPFYIYYCGRFEAINNPAKASAYFRRSIQLFKAQRDLRGLSFVYRWYSELLWKQQQPDSSILMAKNGLQAGQALMNYRNIFYNSRLLSTYYQRLGRTDSAYKYQSIMVAARDSLFSQQKSNQIQSTLIDEQQRVQRLQDEKSQFESQVKVYSLLGVLSGMLLVAGVLYRNNQQKQKTNGHLRTLNQEIEQQKEEIEAQRDYLEETLNELKTTQAQLIQREKLASLGELTAGIAHEIQNPLNFVNNFSEVSTELIDELEGELDKGDTEEAKAIAGDIRQNLQKINHHGSRASSIVKGMLEHSRASSGQRQPTNLNALADEYLRLAYQRQRANDKRFTCELITDFAPALPQVEVVSGEIGRVLLNLYNNAFYAVQQRANQAGDEYKPTVRVTTLRVEKKVQLRVADNGTGIPEGLQQKVFQPFFTTKPTGEGTGLGLSLSYDIITKGHGGVLP
ncbi:ATP-binding protein [Spirosoma sp. KNUC1025]|uniref:ATP-binding protein n=1 Tax=Spirosoma sp. KNUC1025 TaxID=2894082 RepID=UPI001E31108D|nr:ATP-binding protein [Spirosoma sp. KNUC1025]UFH57708.1 two-component sensor histidine kinase [Spirosoma sp. KNUC1025]